MLIVPALPAGASPPDPDAGELAAPCASCHRADGRNTGIPSLSGMDEGHILQRMGQFRQQTHGDQIMHVVANALTPREISALARYFAAHPGPAPQQ